LVKRLSPPSETLTATAAVVWDVHYSHRVQQYAETTPVDALDYTTALHGVQQTLQWAGELAAAIPTQTLALMQERLVAEASTAAWQDYFLFNTALALVGLLPALPCWRRQKYAPAAELPPTPGAATSPRDPVSQAAPHVHTGRTP
jgi:hypothetical protein